jgi:hypothetical protein
MVMVSRVSGGIEDESSVPKSCLEPDGGGDDDNCGEVVD